MREEQLRIYASEIQGQISALEELMPDVEARLDFTSETWVKDISTLIPELCERILKVRPEDPPTASHFIMAEIRGMCAKLYQPWEFKKTLESKRAELRTAMSHLEKVSETGLVDKTTEIMMGGS